MAPGQTFGAELVEVVVATILTVNTPFVRSLVRTSQSHNRTLGQSESQSNGNILIFYWNIIDQMSRCVENCWATRPLLVQSHVGFIVLIGFNRPSKQWRKVLI